MVDMIPSVILNFGTNLCSLTMARNEHKETRLAYLSGHEQPVGFGHGGGDRVHAIIGILDRRAHQSGPEVPAVFGNRPANGVRGHDRTRALAGRSSRMDRCGDDRHRDEAERKFSHRPDRRCRHGRRISGVGDLLKSK